MVTDQEPAAGSGASRGAPLPHINHPTALSPFRTERGQTTREFSDFLKGFVGAVVTAVAVGYVVGQAAQGESFWPPLVLTAMWLLAYLVVTVHYFRAARPWIGFGLIVALLLALPAYTIACFAAADVGESFG